MGEKKKVLIVNNPLQYGGADFVAVRLQQTLDKNKFECIYCLHHGGEIGPYEKQVAQTGVRIIHQPENTSGYIASYKYFCELLSREHFDVIHCHLPFFSGIVLAAAAKCGVKKRVSHSHFSQPLVFENNTAKSFLSRIYRNVMRKIVTKYSTDIIGCTKEAGEYLAGKNGFRKKGVVLNNGIDTDTYKYNEEKRMVVRKQLNIDDKIVIGHIGQMYYVKNQSFLLDVFNDFQKKHTDSVLLLLGDGPDRKMLEDKAATLGIAEKTKFLGFRDDIPELLSAMDCFVFPSVHEGFPLTLAEAQSAKLPCVVSASINESVKLSNALSFISIEDSTEKWCEEIERLTFFCRADIDNSAVISEFKIENIVKKLEKIYLD